MSDPTQLAYLKPAQGPGTGNITNHNGTPLSAFQFAEQHLTSTAISTTFNALLGSQILHETDIRVYTEQLRSAAYLVQAYDNSLFVGFGAIRRPTVYDYSHVGYSTFYGYAPYGTTAYECVTYDVNTPELFGEVAYMWQHPDYAGDKLGTLCLSKLLNIYKLAVGTNHQGLPNRNVHVTCPVPHNLTSDPLHDVLRLFTNGKLSNASRLTANRTELDFEENNYHGLNSSCDFYVLDSTVQLSN